jgi:hypothetical protein
MIEAFLAESVLVGGRRVRLMPVGANHMPSFAIYSGGQTDTELFGYALVLLDVDDPLIARMSVFPDQRLVRRFKLPASIAG